MNDPRFIDPVLFAKLCLDFTPDPIQERILSADVWRGLINCTRQWGKSTLMAIKALHEGLVKPGTTVLVLCPTFRQCGEFFEKVREFMMKLGMRPRTDGHNKVSVRMSNGSRIVGISGYSYIRSFRNVSLLLIDEAAEVPDSAYHTIRPALATAGDFGGSIWMMSTPQGREGMFYRAWEHEGSRWTRFTVNALECPRLKTQFLAEEREILGARMFSQEYLCQFIERPDSLFNREDIHRAIRTDIPKLWPGRKFLQ
jgi:hypothetical protein